MFNRKSMVQRTLCQPSFASTSCLDCLKDRNGPAVTDQMMPVKMTSVVNPPKSGALRKSSAKKIAILVTKKDSANKDQAVRLEMLLNGSFRRCTVSHFTLVSGCSILFKNRRTKTMLIALLNGMQRIKNIK